MKRMLVLVDGLNLFHALKQQSISSENLDIPELCKALAINRDLDLTEIIYFTSLVEHLDNSTINRQFRYLENLQLRGTRVIKGEFRSQLDECRICGSKSRKYFEKQTDVALAAEMIKQAFTGQCEEIIIFSADTDFLPAIEMIISQKPEVKVKVASTVSYLRPIHGALKRIGAGSIRLSPELISKFQFSN